MLVLICNIFMQKRLNEDITDYELLEDLIYHIDKNCPVGAILVFLSVRRSPINELLFICIFLLQIFYNHVFVVDFDLLPTSIAGCSRNLPTN